MCVWFGKPHPWWVRLCQLFALEGTKATSTCTLPLHLQNMCRRAHTFHVGSLSLSKSLFLPLLTHSIGKIRPPSASSQELFSPEKVSWRKTSSHLAPLRHLWPSGSCDKCMCVHDCIWQESCLVHCSIVYRTQNLPACTSHMPTQAPFSSLLCKWNQ